MANEKYREKPFLYEDALGTTSVKKMSPVSDGDNNKQEKPQCVFRSSYPNLRR